jgi:two-component system chemotaxis response regulator CheY
MPRDDDEVGEVLRLPPVLDLAAAEVLLHTLQDALFAGRILRLDASVTETVTTPCIQIILSAVKMPRNFSIENPSPAFLAACSDLGVGLKFNEVSDDPAHAPVVPVDTVLAPDLDEQSAAAASSAKRVLTIDDSKTMRDMLYLTLNEAGYDVIQAVDGEDGIEVLGDQRVDVVITDINMPKMDGYGVIRNLRANPVHKTTPILVLTTESDSEKKNLAREAGATGWMVKPFDPERLISTVRKVSP